ncbi:MAG TPA: hypothetical protein VLI67_05425, partial [Vicinamibacteria bacterium]|nr:hypothetical protein [Vicinamibacteria bacterium]
AQLQLRIWRGHSYGTGSEPYTSRWYTWPWLYRPPLFHYEKLEGNGGVVRLVLAIGNPAVWWLSLPAALLALGTGVWRREPRRMFGAFGLCVTYLAWAFVPRAVQYSYYFFECVPWGCLSLAFFLDRGWDGRLGILCRGFVLAAGALFLHLLPVLTALPIPEAWFFHRLFDGVYPWRWFSSWY